MTYTEKDITNEDNNIVRVCHTSIMLLIFMSDIFFCICLMRDVLFIRAERDIRIIHSPVCIFRIRL